MIFIIYLPFVIRLCTVMEMGTFFDLRGAAEKNTVLYLLIIFLSCAFMILPATVGHFVSSYVLIPNNRDRLFTHLITFLLNLMGILSTTFLSMYTVSVAGVIPWMKSKTSIKRLEKFSHEPSFSIIFDRKFSGYVLLVFLIASSSHLIKTLINQEISLVPGCQQMTVDAVKLSLDLVDPTTVARSNQSAGLMFSLIIQYVNPQTKSIVPVSVTGPQFDGYYSDDFIGNPGNYSYSTIARDATFNCSSASPSDLLQGFQAAGNLSILPPGTAGNIGLENQVIISLAPSTESSNSLLITFFSSNINYPLPNPLYNKSNNAIVATIGGFTCKPSIKEYEATVYGSDLFLGNVKDTLNDQETAISMGYVRNIYGTIQSQSIAGATSAAVRGDASFMESILQTVWRVTNNIAVEEYGIASQGTPILIRCGTVIISRWWLGLIGITVTVLFSVICYIVVRKSLHKEIPRCKSILGICAILRRSNLPNIMSIGRGLSRHKLIKRYEKVELEYIQDSERTLQVANPEVVMPSSIRYSPTFDNDRLDIVYDDQVESLKFEKEDTPSTEAVPKKSFFGYDVKCDTLYITCILLSLLCINIPWIVAMISTRHLVLPDARVEAANLIIVFVSNAAGSISIILLWIYMEDISGMLPWRLASNDWTHLEVFEHFYGRPTLGTAQKIMTKRYLQKKKYIMNVIAPIVIISIAVPVIVNQEVSTVTGCKTTPAQVVGRSLNINDVNALNNSLINSGNNVTTVISMWLQSFTPSTVSLIPPSIIGPEFDGCYSSYAIGNPGNYSYNTLAHDVTFDCYGASIGDIDIGLAGLSILGLNVTSLAKMTGNITIAMGPSPSQSSTGALILGFLSTDPNTKLTYSVSSLNATVEALTCQPTITEYKASVYGSQLTLESKIRTVPILSDEMKMYMVFFSSQ